MASPLRLRGASGAQADKEWEGLSRNVELLTVRGTGIGPESLTLLDIYKRKKTNDPLQALRETYAKEGVGAELTFELSDLPDKPCIDLSGVKLEKLCSKWLEDLPGAVFLDLSDSKIEMLPKKILECKFQTLVLRRVNPEILKALSETILALADEEKSCSLRRSVTCLDVSEVSLGEDAFNITQAFFFAERIFMRGCSLKSFPLDLRAKRTILKVIDVSHNDIQNLPLEFYQFGCNNICHPGTFSAKKKGENLKPLSMALKEGKVKEISKGVYVGVDQEDQGISLHCDLRHNPLDKETHRIFNNFERIRLSDSHQLVCLPGNFFVYYDLPKPRGFLGKRV